MVVAQEQLCRPQFQHFNAGGDFVELVLNYVGAEDRVGKIGAVVSLPILAAFLTSFCHHVTRNRTKAYRLLIGCSRCFMKRVPARSDGKGDRYLGGPTASEFGRGHGKLCRVAC